MAVAPNADTDAADDRVLRALSPVLDALKAERASRRRAVVVLSCALAVSFAAGGGVLAVAGRVQTNTGRIEREAVARNVALCEAGNEFRATVGGALSQLLDLGAAADRELPAEQRAAAEVRRSRSREIGAKAFAPEDCAAISRTRPVGEGGPAPRP